jgi:RNA polymerase sigma factor (TIGR02999 family)
MKAPPDEVARLLRRWREGDLYALAELMPRVYDDFCRLARVLLRQEEDDPLLQPAALVHDIYLRLRGIHAPGWDTRAHFYGFVLRMMRQLLVDHARTRRRAKRGEGARHLPLEEALDCAAPDGPDSPEGAARRALSEALDSLGRFDPRLVRIVELRYFMGLTTEETAAACGVSPATVKRDWQAAKAWLRRALA